MLSTGAIWATEGEVMEEVESAVGNFFTTYQVPLRIVAILAIAVLAHWVLRLLLRRMVNRVVQGVKRKENVVRTEEMASAPSVRARAVQRTRTLGTIGRHVITWTIVVVTLMAILTQLQVNLTAVLASAGVIAAGLAFGAQNIVKDILNGIFMVVEDQLGVGDWVTIGEIAGTVEDVGIRITKVRGTDGTLWFVRNGEVLTLGNSSQGWGRALVDVTIEADSDIARAEDVALAAAREALSSPQYVRRVMGEPEVWGLQSVSGDRATLRLAVRTRPEAHWAVERGLRAALSRSFHEHGIKMASELPGFGGGSA